MKKIVLITGNTKGGIIQFLETIETKLNDLGYEVIVIAPVEVESKLQNKKNYVYYQSVQSGNRIKSFFSKQKVLKDISDKIAELKADLIWLVDNPMITVKIGLKLIHTRIPMMLTLHDAGGSHPTNEAIYHKLRRKYTHFLSNKLENEVDYILLLSKVSLEKYQFLKKQNKSKLVYFCLGAHVPDVEEIRPAEVTEKQFHLFFGRIDKYKGIDILLSAFSQVQNYKYKLIIAGNGELTSKEKELYDQVKDDVILINRYILDEEMLWLFHHARSVVLPYIEATQSGVIPIAYKFGVPVIVSNVDGLTQFVEDEKTGFVCESEIDYITSLKKLENDNTRSAMSENAVQYHLQHMNWEKNIAAVLDEIST